MRFIRWVNGWLLNRRACAMVGEDKGRTRTFREGLPQGAVISPILFVIFINDLLDRFKSDTTVSAFADDLAAARRGRNKELLEKEIQEETDKVVEWSRKWRLQLSPAKCETCLFTTNSAEAS